MKGLTFLLAVIVSMSLHAQEVRILNLQECIDIAIENNLNVKRSRLDVESARAGLLQSKGSLLPNANVNGNYGFNWGRSIDPTTNQFINQQIQFAGAGGSSNVTLFNGFSLINGVKQSQANLEARQYGLEFSENTITLNIINSYLSVIFNRELVENAKYQLESSREQLERTTKLVEAGSLPITNKLELQSQVASNEVQLVNNQNQLDLAVLSLKQAMLIPASEQIDVIIPDMGEINVETIEKMSGQEVYEIAEQEQPEIRSADLGLEAANYGYRSALGGYYPSLSLGLNINTNFSNAFTTRRLPDGTFDVQPTGAFAVVNGEQFDVLAPSPNFETVPFGLERQFEENLRTSLGINLQIPIFNGFRTRANVQRAKIAVQQAEITAIEQRNTLRQQIETAYNNALAAAKTYEANLRQVEALEETFRLVENQYNLGAANFTDYQVANNNLFGARSDLLRAKYDFVFRKKILEFYQGQPVTFETN